MPKRKTSPKKAAFAKNRVIYTIVGVVLLAPSPHKCGSICSCGTPHKNKLLFKCAPSS